MDQLTNNKYDTLLQGQVSIKDHYASIIDFKKSQAKINLLISLPDNSQAENQQLKQMKGNIEIALKQQISVLRDQQKKVSAYPLSVQLLIASDVGKLAKCFIQEEKKWKNSVVLEVDIEEQIAKIKRYGKQGTTMDLPAYYLKVLKQPDPQLFIQGTHCKAIYSGDGQFYPCIIQKITQEGYHVRYKKYQSQQIVELHRLRPMQNHNQKNDQVKFEDLTQLKIPDKLKIMPNDPQNVKKSKKNKVKALKLAFKNAKLEQVNRQKQDKWKQWNSNGSKMGYFKTKHDLDIIYSKDKETK